MNTDLAPVEIYIPADAWLKPVAVPHSMTHEDIDRLVSEFMSSGGAIKEIPVGVSGDSAPAMFNGRVRSMGKQTAQEIKDEPFVAALDVLLDCCPDRKGAADALGIRDYVLQRLLSNYFGRDKRADKIRAPERKDCRQRFKVIRDEQWKLNHGQIAKIDGVMVKRCSACRETKPVTEYHAKKDSHAGICTRCKACVAIEKAAKKHGAQDEKAAA
ncbi:TPA: hypothetical protein OW416_005598 [Pseudomonas aeruginosa]|nr:hypothetical protein [Pseudomonas aeruginosa]